MYIKKVEIKNLWGQDFIWKLKDDVNVLVGENGSGKSTILNIIKEAILPYEDSVLNFRVFDPIDEVIIELKNNMIIRTNSEERQIITTKDERLPRLSYINTFDVVETNHFPNTSLLDFEIEKLKNEFVRYQRDLSNKVEEAFKNTSVNERETELDKIQSLYKTKNLFVAKINSLFKHTEKVFDEMEFCFKKKNIENPIKIKNLSSGEKQILIILLTTLLQDNKESILLLDEPEISLHIDWQRELIKHIRELNPNCQVILTTHSPSVYYKGWTEKATRISELFTPTNFSIQSKIISELINENIEEHVINAYKNFTKIIGGSIWGFNKSIANVYSLSLQQSIELLNYCNQVSLKPDIETVKVLFSKLNSYKEAKKLFDIFVNQTFKVPIEISALNALLTRIDGVETGITLLREIGELKILQLRPDARSFSIILGKAKNAEEIKLIEETRKYYGIQFNEVYFNKLKLKQ